MYFVSPGFRINRDVYQVPASATVTTVSTRTSNIDNLFLQVIFPNCISQRKLSEVCFSKLLLFISNMTANRKNEKWSLFLFTVQVAQVFLVNAIELASQVAVENSLPKHLPVCLTFANSMGKFDDEF